MKTSGTYICRNTSGLTFTTAALLAKMASLSDSSVSIASKGNTCQAANFLSVILMGIKCGDLVEICAEGPDASEVVQHVGDLLAA